MSQTPETQPSSSSVSNVESDIAQTIGLGSTIYTLIREPVVLAYGNITKAQKLKKSFGFWQEEALATDGRYSIPLLRLKEFEAYLVERDGIVPAAPPAPEANPGTMGILNSWTKRPNPLGLPPAGSASWTYLLFALGICPGMRVVSWRPMTEGFVNTQAGGIQMEIEGSVLCHIINLFSVAPYHKLEPEYQRETKKLPNRRLERRCELPFGELSWDMNGNSFHAHFDPGSKDDLLSMKWPFGPNGQRIDPQGGTIMASYFTALVTGVSHSEYQLASADKPLRERITRVIACFMLLRRRFWESLSEGPIMFSYDWFEMAARVKRRALAQGGQDHSFYEDVSRAIDDEPRLSFDESQRYRQKKSLRELFLFDNDTFTFEIAPRADEAPKTSYRIRDEMAYDIMQQIVVDTLFGYGQQPAGSWKHNLFEMRDEVLKLLNIERVVNPWGFNIELIEFTRQCELWDKKIFLGAPN